MAFDAAGGRAMSAVELQARFGSRQWGLLKNATVVKTSDQAPFNSLEVTLAPVDEEEPVQNGVGFTWERPDMAKASWACLSYSVFLPAGFGFKEPGHLPGIFGARDATQIDEVEPEAGFAARVGWGLGGESGIDVLTPGATGYWEIPPRKTVWPTGRWVTVEQELQLNSPGNADGLMRLWIDGSLTINRHGITLRKTDALDLSGVVSDIRYARTVSTPDKIRVSPFVLQWQ